MDRDADPAAPKLVEVGSEVTHLKVGQKVATVDGHGSHAELRPVPARNCWPIPDGFDPKLAAVIPVAFGTAHDCLFEFGHLAAGETVLVQAGAGGVGLAAIQLAKAAGASLVLAGIGLVLWGAGASPAIAAQQARLIAADPNAASATVALNTSLLYAGQAIGTSLGGWALASGHADRSGMIAVPRGRPKPSLFP